VGAAEATAALASERLADTLARLEHHIDAAFATAGELSTELVHAKQAHNLSSVVGQSAFAAFGKAHLALVEARGHAVSGHRLLEQLGKYLGIDTTAFGDGVKDGSGG
jgi:hypothetical protein